MLALFMLLISGAFFIFGLLVSYLPLASPGVACIFSYFPSDVSSLLG